MEKTTRGDKKLICVVFKGKRPDKFQFVYAVPHPTNAAHSSDVALSRYATSPKWVCT